MSIDQIAAKWARSEGLGFVHPSLLEPVMKSAINEAVELVKADHRQSLELISEQAKQQAHELAELRKYRKRMEWLHDCSNGSTDSEGYEWGIFRVKWEFGQPVSVMQTNSDFSDLDAEMAKEPQ